MKANVGKWTASTNGPDLDYDLKPRNLTELETLGRKNRELEGSFATLKVLLATNYASIKM